MANYEAVWRVLADLVTEFRKMGETVPSHVVNDLRSAKTTMQILKVDEDNPDHLLRIEEFLANVESYVICWAQKRFEARTFDGWMDRLESARREVHKIMQPRSNFVPGTPRDKHWIRVKASNDVPLKRIKSVAQEVGLEHKIHKSEYLIVYGEKGKIRSFIKRMAELHRD